MSIESIPRESRELVGPITVTATTPAGTPVSTASLELTVLARGDRPLAGWEVPLTVSGGLFLLVGPPDRTLTPGPYVIWGRLTDTPELPVFEVGVFLIT